MPSARARKAKGFTLLETTIALAILAFAALGALAGLNGASQELRRGQLRLIYGAMADGTLQRLKLDSAGRATLPVNAPPVPSAIGATGWIPDPSPAVDRDLSTGAYFRALPTGEVTAAADVAANTSCADVPAGVVCREIMVTSGIGDLSCLTEADCPSLPTATGVATTVWVRVWHQGDPEQSAVVHREVFIQ